MFDGDTVFACWLSNWECSLRIPVAYWWCFLSQFWERREARSFIAYSLRSLIKFSSDIIDSNFIDSYFYRDFICRENADSKCSLVSSPSEILIAVFNWVPAPVRLSPVKLCLIYLAKFPWVLPDVGLDIIDVGGDITRLTVSIGDRTRSYCSNLFWT